MKDFFSKLWSKENLNDPNGHIAFIYDIHKRMREKELILVYEGEFSQDITKAFVSLAEQNLDKNKEDRSVKRKVFNVMVECLQNIVKHSDPIEEEEAVTHASIFMVGRQGNDYIVSSGNPIVNEKAPELSSFLDKINSLDKEELKKFFKEELKKSRISDKGGAGLGFIDMAKKTGSKLDYYIQRIDERYSFFSFQTKISRSK